MKTYTYLKIEIKKNYAGKMECDICSTRQKTVFESDNCGNQIFRSCGSLSATEVKVLELKKERILKFECPKCRKFETCMLLKNIIEERGKSLQSKDEIIVLLKQKMEILEGKLNQKADNQLQYSEILKKHSTRNSETNIPSISAIPSLPHLIIKT